MNFNFFLLLLFLAKMHCFQLSSNVAQGRYSKILYKNTKSFPKLDLFQRSGGSSVKSFHQVPLSSSGHYSLTKLSLKPSSTAAVSVGGLIQYDKDADEEDKPYDPTSDEDQWFTAELFLRPFTLFYLITQTAPLPKDTSSSLKIRIFGYLFSFCFCILDIYYDHRNWKRKNIDYDPRGIDKYFLPSSTSSKQIILKRILFHFLCTLIFPQLAIQFLYPYLFPIFGSMKDIPILSVKHYKLAKRWGPCLSLIYWITCWWPYLVDFVIGNMIYVGHLKETPPEKGLTFEERKKYNKFYKDLKIINAYLENPYNTKRLLTLAFRWISVIAFTLLNIRMYYGSITHPKNIQLELVSLPLHVDPINGWYPVDVN
jgi:hypothetical protein